MTVAYVSGGGSGIGREIAGQLVVDGWQVVIFGRRAHRLDETVQQVREAVPSAVLHPVVADLADPASVAAAVEAARALAGDAVDAVVNNAGGLSALPAGSLAEVAAEWTDSFRINVLTAVLLTAATLPHLRRPGARVVSITSIAALRGGGSYGAAKAALHPWTYDLARRLGPGCTANVVAPGLVEETEFFGDAMTSTRRQTMIDQTTTGRVAVPADVAATVRWLLSPAAAQVSGQVIQVNGGALPGRG